MAFHYPAVGLNPFWNPHYVQLLGFRSKCIAVIAGGIHEDMYCFSRINRDSDLVTRDVVKAVEAPELPSQAGCPVLGQMGT